MSNQYMVRWTASPRQRMSRVDWDGLLGDDQVAMRQMAWERGRTALAMHRAGMTYVEIGRRLNVTPTRATQIVNMGGYREGHLSPVERWMQAAERLPLVLNSYYTDVGLRMLANSLAPLRGQTKRDWLFVASARR